MKYILIVILSGGGYHGPAISMQEFDDVPSCKRASLEVSERYSGAKMVCVPKGYRAAASKQPANKGEGP